jgi:hypothetical protein
VVRVAAAVEVLADRPVARRLFGRAVLAAVVLALSGCETPTFDPDTATFTFRRRETR